jgi:hypothetical protein
MKIVNVVLALIFLLFAGWQYNDPDPYIWMPIYLFTAIVCGMAAYKNYATWITLGGLLVLSIYALTYIPALIEWIKLGMPSLVETMKAETPYIEKIRELGGLMIAIIVLAFQYFTGKKVVSN